MYDIDEVINPEVIKQLDIVESKIGNIVKGLDKVYEAAKKSSDTTGAGDVGKGGKGKKDTLSDEEKAAKKLLETEQKLEKVRSGALDAQIKANAELQKANTERKKSVTVNQAEATSMDGVSKKLGGLKEQYRALTAEQRKSAEGKAMHKSISELDDEIKQLDASIGNHQRNVGNYRDALQVMPGWFGKASQGAGGFGQALGAVSKTPLLLVFTMLITLGTKLFESFGKTERGADMMAEGMSMISGIINVIVDRAAKLVDYLIKAFSDPKKAILDLGKFIVQNIANRFTALADIAKALGIILVNVFSKAGRESEEYKKALQDLGVAMIQVNTGLTPEDQQKLAEAIKGVVNEVNNETIAMRKLEQAMDDLEEKRLDNSLEMTRLNVKLQQYRVLADDANKSDQERMQAAKNAIATRNKIIDLQREELIEEFRIKMQYETKEEAEKRILELKKKGNTIAIEEIGISEKNIKDKEEAVGLANEILNLEADRFQENKREYAKMHRFEAELTEAKRKAREDEIKMMREVSKEHNAIQAGKLKAATEAANGEVVINQGKVVKLLESEAYTLGKKKEGAEAEKEIKHNAFLDFTHDLEAREALEAAGYQATNDMAINFVTARSESEKAKIQEQAQAEKDILKSKLDAGLISETEYKKKLEKIDLDARIKTAKADKKAALFQIAISTLIEGAKAGFITGKAILIYAMGAIQAAVIAAKPIPKFAKGGVVGTNDPVMVGEAGAELIETKNRGMMLANKATIMDGIKGARVYTAAQTRAMMGGDRGIAKDGGAIQIIKQEQRITERGIITVVSNGRNKQTYIEKYL